VPTDLTASEIRVYITTLQRSLGGATRVEFADGRSVTYANDDAKLAAIRYWEALLAGLSPTTAAPARLIMGTTRGLWPYGWGY